MKTRPPGGFNGKSQRFKVRSLAMTGAPYGRMVAWGNGKDRKGVKSVCVLFLFGL